MKTSIETEIRTTSANKNKGDESLEKSLRPKTFDAYIGQSKVKENLAVYIKAAKLRGENLDHCLLFGPPGLGKTTLAAIIANEMGVNLKVTTGPAITKPGELAAILSQLKENDILFIDEIHRLSKPIEEVLYSAMEDFAIDIVIGSGQQSKSMRIPIPKFTLIGATTHAGLLSAPLRDRFGIIFHMEFYSNEELLEIVNNSAQKMNVSIDNEGAAEIASRSRGTPRLANRWLKRVRDFADVNANGVIDRSVAVSALDAIDVDSVGLDYNDKKILLCIIDQFNGGPVGLSTLSASIGVEEDIIADVYEPYLILKGYINRTPKGREASKAAYEHFGRSFEDK